MSNLICYTVFCYGALRAISGLGSCSLKGLIYGKRMECHNSMSLGVRKPVFRVSGLVRHKSGCSALEDG